MCGPAPHHSYDEYRQLRTLGPEPLVEYHFDLLILHFGLLPTDLAASGCALHRVGPLEVLSGQGLLACPLGRDEEGSVGGAGDMRRTYPRHSQPEKTA